MQHRRILSIDVFRGLTVAGMVLVNNPGTWGAVYGPLRHADWHGWTPTDLIFPFFLFIVGVAIPLALGRRLGAGKTKGRVVLRIVRRSAVIFTLGLILHAVSNFDAATIRIPGVLQRIAVCYLVAALLFVFTGWRVQAGAAVIALLSYWALLTLVPVPAIATTLFGVLTGRFIKAGRSGTVTAGGFLIAGVAGITAGLVWAQFFPINKSLWTSSYAVFTAGVALVILAACYWLIEIKGSTWWTSPFVILGVNALAVFFLSTLLAIVLARIHVTSGAGQPRALQAMLFEALFTPWLRPAAASLAWALATVLLWLLAMWPLYRKGIRIPV